MTQSKKYALLLFFGVHIGIICYNNLNLLQTFSDVALSQIPTHSQAILSAITSLPTRLPMEIDLQIKKYGSFTGADTGYGFFSPNVPDMLYVIFKLTKEDGESSFKLPIFQSKEGFERFTVNLSLFKQMEEVRPLLARSWAVRMLEMYPEYSQAEVVLCSYALPSMSGYVTGEKMTYLERGRYAFALNQTNTTSK